MNLIVAVDKNWNIGNKGDLLVSIPEDMKFFRTTTMNNIVVMGRKTLESFPNKKPLKNRTNIILTTNKDYVVENAIVVYSIDELLNLLSTYNQENIYVIGGSSIYKQLLDKCEKAYVTKIDNVFEADTDFPNLDDMKNWECVEKSEKKKYENLEYEFCTYKNIKRDV